MEEMGRDARILVVDGDDMKREAVTRILKAASCYEVSEAATGAECLRLAQETMPDLILLDRLLPGIDGAEVCRQIKASAQTTRIFVALMSAIKTSSDSQANGLEAGADEYIAQPISDRELLARARAMLRIKHAEDKLRESEQSFRTVADFTHDWEYWVGVDGRHIYVSPSCERITGYRAAEFMQDPGLLEMIVHPDDRAAFDRHLHEGFEGGDESTLDFRIITRGGEERWINHVCQPVYGAGGRWLGRRASNRDITERKRAEHALEESEERYRGLFENASIGIFHSTPEGRFLRVNPVLASMLGYASADELVSTITDGSRQVYVDSPRRPEIVADILRQGGWIRAENRYRRKDGSILTGKLAARRVLKPDGTVAYLEGFVEDITERKRAEQELALKVEQLAALSQAAQIVNASLELDQVLAEIVALAARVAPSDHAGVVLVDERGQLVRSAENLPGMPALQYRIRDEGFTRWIIHSRQAVIVDEIGPDGAVTPESEQGAPRFANPHLVEAGVKALAGLPLLVKDRLVGVLWLHSLRAGAFHGEALLLTTFANQAALAVENARLYEAVQQELAERKRAEEALRTRAAQLTILNDVGGQIAAVLDLDSVLQRAVQLVQESFGYHHAGLFVLDGARGELVMRAKAGDFTHLFPPDHRLKLGQGMVGWAGQHGQTLLSNSVDTEPRFVNLYPGVVPTASELSVPLQIGEETIGVLDVQSPQRDAFSENDVLVMETLADQIAVAIENARLYEAVRRELAERKQAESQRDATLEALRASETRYRTLFENAPIGIYRTTPDGGILAANPALIQMLGYSSFDELATRNLEQEGYHPDYPRSRFKERIEREGEVRGMDSLWAKRDGSTICVRENARAVREADGTVLYYEGTVEDITEHKQAEEKVRRRSRELALFNQIIAASVSSSEPEAILEVACRELAGAFDVPQVIAVLLNEQKTEAAIVAEYSAAESAQTALGGVFPVKGDPSLQYLLGLRAPLIVEDVQYDPRLASMHGVFQESGTASLLLLPLLIKGEVVGGLSLVTTEPRHFSPEEISLAWSVADQVAGALARAQLAQTQQRLIAAIEQAAESVIITDNKGVLLYVNPGFEQASGYSRAEVIGKDVMILSSGKHDAAFYDDLWATIRAGRVWHGRFINRKKDGSLYTEDATITPVRGENGAIVSYVSVQRDVTRELQLEEQYRQAQKMELVGRLTAGIAHDFNNLLTAINGFAELARSKMAPEDPLRESLDRILTSGWRAADLVRQLMAFSRKQAVEPEVLILNEAVANMDKMLRRVIGEDIALKTVLAPDVWRVKVDPTQIEQVVVNLAVNARDAMPDGGHLTIETANVVLDEDYAAHHLGVQPGRYVALAVSDDGTGMSDEVKAHLFEPFFTTKGSGKGTGLGLATVFGIVKGSDGHVWCYSEVGQGTTFKIYLPAIQSAAVSAVRREEPSGLPGGNETILLVEDDPAVRELTARVLRQEGYTVLAASNGDEALRLGQEHRQPIHLLLTDVVMPGLSGRALIEQLAQIYPSLKALFMSGYTDDAIVHQGVLEPGVAFLQKPFGTLALAHKVRGVLDTA